MAQAEDQWGATHKIEVDAVEVEISSELEEAPLKSCTLIPGGGCTSKVCFWTGAWLFATPFLLSERSTAFPARIHPIIEGAPSQLLPSRTLTSRTAAAPPLCLSLTPSHRLFGDQDGELPEACCSWDHDRCGRAPLDGFINNGRHMLGVPREQSQLHRRRKGLHIWGHICDRYGHIRAHFHVRRCSHRRHDC